MKMKESFDRANPNTLADLMRKAGLGQLLRAQVSQILRLKTPALATNIVATLAKFDLPNDCKAALITRAYARATTAAGTLGELAIQAPNAVPIDAQIAIAPTGDVVVLDASKYVDVDVEFIPSRGDVVELASQEVVADVLTIPATLVAKGVVYLIAVNVLAGGATGAKIVDAPGTAPAAGHAALDLAKATIAFGAADAVTSASVTLLVAATLDLDTLLEGTDELI